jgi:hypothetical protein
LVTRPHHLPVAVVGLDHVRGLFCGLGRWRHFHERGRVTFVYSTLEIRDEFIAVLFNGHDEALAVPADSVRKVSTRQS